MRQNKVVVVEGNISDIFIHAFTKERIKHIGMIKSKGEEKKEPKKESRDTSVSADKVALSFSFLL